MTQFHEYKHFTSYFQKILGFETTVDHFHEVCDKVLRNPHSKPLLDAMPPGVRDTFCCVSMTLHAEQLWKSEYSARYVKIEPAMLSALADTDVLIPSTMIRDSIKNTVFLVRFPVLNQPFDGLYRAAFFYCWDYGDEFIVGYIIFPAETDSSPVLCRISCMEDTVIETAFAKEWEIGGGDGHISKFDFLSLLRVCTCAAFFLHDKHELVMPDLTRQEITKYRKAQECGDEGRMQHLRQKATNRNGFIIGRREIDLPVPIITYQGDANFQTRTGRELTRGHVRRGHLRRQAIGKREEKQHKTIWLPPTVVRPDLPMGETGSGYRIPDPPLPTTVSQP